MKEIVILFFMLYNNIRFFKTIIFKYKFNYLVSNKIKFINKNIIFYLIKKYKFINLDNLFFIRSIGIK